MTTHFTTIFKSLNLSTISLSDQIEKIFIPQALNSQDQKIQIKIFNQLNSDDSISHLFENSQQLIHLVSKRVDLISNEDLEKLREQLTPSKKILWMFDRFVMKLTLVESNLRWELQTISGDVYQGNFFYPPKPENPYLQQIQKINQNAKATNTELDIAKIIELSNLSKTIGDPLKQQLIPIFSFIKKNEISTEKLNVLKIQFEHYKKNPIPLGQIYYEMATNKTWAEKRMLFLEETLQSSDPELKSPQVLKSLKKILRQEIAKIPSSQVQKLGDLFTLQHQNCYRWVISSLEMDAPFLNFPGYPTPSSSDRSPVNLSSSDSILPSLISPSAKTFLQEIRKWCELAERKFKEKSYVETACFVEAAFDIFPSLNDQFWDQISKEQLLDVAEQIQLLTGIGGESLAKLRNQGWRNSLRALILLYRGYAFTHRALYRVQEMHLDKFAVRSILDQFPFSCIVTANDERHLKSIQEYFQTVNKNHFTAIQLDIFFEASNWNKCPAPPLIAQFSTPELDQHRNYIRHISSDPISQFLKDLQDPDCQKTSIRGYRLLAYYSLFGAPWHEKPHYFPHQHSNGMKVLAYSTFQGFYATAIDDRVQNILTPLELQDRLNPIQDPFLKNFCDPTKAPRIRLGNRGQLGVVRRSTENEVLTEKKAAAPLEERVYHELSNLRVHGLTQISMAIDWCESHIPLLDNLDVQTYLEAVFFERGLLEQTKENLPKVYQRVQEFFRYITYYYKGKTQGISPTLFWLRRAGALEFFTSKELISILEELQSRAWICDEEKSAVALYKVAFGNLSLHQTIQAWLDFISSPFKSLLTPDWVIDVARKKIYELRETLQPAHLGQGWEGRFPCYTQGKKQMNLLEGLIVYEGRQLMTSWPEETKKSPLITKFFTEALPPVYQEISNSKIILETLDHQTIIIFQKNQFTIQRNLQFYGLQDVWAEYLPSSHNPSFQTWLLKTFSSEIAAWIIDSQNRPYACAKKVKNSTQLNYTKTKDGTTYHRIQAKLGWTNLPDEVRHLLNGTLGLLTQQDVIDETVWIWATSEVSGYQIDHIHLPLLNLIFYFNSISGSARKEGPSCSHRELEGFVVSHSIPAIAKLPYALAFQNSSGQTKVLVSDQARKSTYIFQPDPSGHWLHSTSVQGKLFLLKHYLIQKRHGVLLRTLQTLNPLRPYTPAENEVLNELLKSATDPQGALIALRIAAQVLKDDEDLKVQSAAYQIDDKSALTCWKDCLIDHYTTCKADLTLIEKKLLINQFLKIKNLDDKTKETFFAERDQINQDLSGFSIPPLPLPLTLKQHLPISRGFEIPLEEISTAFEISQEPQQNSSEFRFQAPMNRVNPLTQKMYQSLAKAFKAIPPTQAVIYTLKTREDVKSQLKSQIQKDTHSLFFLRQKIKNSLLPLSKNLKIEDLIIDLDLLVNSDIQQDLIQYMLISCRMTQAQEAFQLIEQNRLQEAGEVVSKKRHYNPYNQPLLLIYEYATGKFLRPRQAEILQWIFESQANHSWKQLLVEFEAGGGKTKVVSAILISHLAKQNKLPIFVSLPELHEITKEDLRDALSQVFRKKLKPLNIALHDSIQDPEELYQTLCLWQSQGYCCQITPSTFHSIHLQYLLALENNKLKAIEYLGKIYFEFFQGQTAFLIDEAHRNADALWQAIITAGKPTSLNPDEQQLLVFIYEELLKLPTINLRDNQQAQIPPQTLKTILFSLNDALIIYLKIPPSSAPAVKTYWADLTQKTAPQTPNLELVNLVRGLLNFVLPNVLQMIGELDYGTSLDPLDDLAAPKKNKSPTLSKYENPEIAAALTIQRLYQVGLNSHQMSRLLIQMMLEHELHLKEGDTLEKSEAQKQFETWTQGIAVIPPFHSISAHDDQQVSLLTQEIGKRDDVVKRYLLKHALAQVQFYPTKYSSNYADLIDGSHSTIAFSATLGMPEQYLFEQENDQAHYDDLAFQASVLQVACEPRNSTVIWMEPSLDLNKILTKIFKNENNYEGMIDSGGLTKQYSTEEFAHQFLDFATSNHLPYQGVVFIKDQGFEPQIMILFQNNGKKESVALEGSDLKKGLQKHGLNQLRLFKFYGPSQTTGTDLLLDRDAKMLVTVGEGIKLWNQIQALMRMRGFLKPSSSQQTGQTAIWVAPQTLKNQIQSSHSSCGVQQILQFALLQQAKQIEQIIEARAYLGIEHLIKKAIHRKLQNRSDEQTLSFNTHRAAFVDSVHRASYEGSVTEENTQILLNAYATQFKSKSRLLGQDWTESDEKNLQALISQVANILPTLRTTICLPFTAEMTHHALGEEEEHHVVKASTPLMAEGQHHTQQEQQQQNQQQEDQIHLEKKSRPADRELYTTAEYSLSNPSLFQNSSHSKSANEVHALTIFDPSIYYLRNTYKTFIDQADAKLKPIYYLLFVQEEEQKRYYLVSIEDAADYMAQLKTGNTSKRQAALFSTQTGKLIQNGTGNLAIPCAEELKNDPNFCLILSQIGWMQGKPNFLKFSQDWQFKHQEVLKQHLRNLPQHLYDVDQNSLIFLEKRLLSTQEPTSPTSPASPTSGGSPNGPTNHSIIKFLQVLFGITLNICRSIYHSILKFFHISKS